jgi:hypothetical protein
MKLLDAWRLRPARRHVSPRGLYPPRGVPTAAAVRHTRGALPLAIGLARRFLRFVVTVTLAEVLTLVF